MKMIIDGDAIDEQSFAPIIADHRFKTHLKIWDRIDGGSKYTKSLKKTSKDKRKKILKKSPFLCRREIADSVYSMAKFSIQRFSC